MPTNIKEEDGWDSIDLPEPDKDGNIEFDLGKKKPVEKKATEAEVEDVPELEGIDTDGAQKRIKQLIRQRKERDERLAEVEAKLAKREADFAAISNEREAAKVTAHKNELSSLDSAEVELNNKIKRAEKDYTDAFDSGDRERQLEAIKSLGDAQGELKIARIRKGYLKENEPRVPEKREVRDEAIAPRPIKAAQDWVRDNKDWWEKDRVATAAALAIDIEMKEAGEDPTSEDYYEELTKRLKKEMPHKFDAEEEVEERNEGSRPRQLVSGASRKSPSNRVKITQNDLAWAKKLGISIEELGKHKKRVEDAKATERDGDYAAIL